LDNSTQVYSVDQAANLGFSFGATDAKYSRRIYVKNFVQYKEIQEGEARVWYGVGIRWVVNVKVIDANARLSGIPLIAAAAENSSVEASSQFQVMGLNNPAITLIAQGVPAELNLENYGNMYAAFTRITELISNTATVVTPLVVAKVVEEKDTEAGYANGLVTSWALARLADGKNLQDAQNMFPDATLSDKEIIRSVYVYFTSSDLPTRPPTSVARARAAEMMRRIQVKR
jgi:hypothetical protein